MSWTTTVLDSQWTWGITDFNRLFDWLFMELASYSAQWCAQRTSMTHISNRQSIAFEVLTTYHAHIRFSTLIFGHNSPASGRYKLIALTNNFSRVDVPPEERMFLGWDDGATPTHLLELFDDFCDSSSLGMRFVAIPSATEAKLMECICMTENRNMAFTY